MGHPVLDEVAGTLDALAAAELSDSQSVVRLHSLRARLDAIRTDIVGRWEAGGEWAMEGAKTAAAWLAYRCRIPQKEAHRTVRLARTCRKLPAAREAWLAGRIDSAHVAALGRVRNARTCEHRTRDEAQLVGYAESMRFSHFQRLIAYWHQRADADGVEDEAAKQVEDRRADISPTIGGMVVGDFVLDPIRGAIVSEEHDRRYDELFQADWQEAKERLGRDPLPAELWRTPAQRRADALVEMAIRSATPEKKGKRPAPLFTVLVDLDETMKQVCELADGTVVTPGSLVPHLSFADVERVVLGAKSRKIDVSHTVRLFPDAERRFITVRDRGECTDPTCEERSNLQVDHIQPYEAWGPTITANGRLRCGFHNRNRHKKRGPP